MVTAALHASGVVPAAALAATTAALLLDWRDWRYWVATPAAALALVAGVCHWIAMYGQLKEPPLRSMSLIRVSIGVFPTRRTKNNCSMTWALTERREGSRRRSLPNRVGWLGYWLLTYSSSAHWDFSWRLSTWAESDKPHASAKTQQHSGQKLAITSTLNTAFRLAYVFFK